MSKQAIIYNQKAEVVGELELPGKVFEVAMNQALVHQVMVGQMSNQRQVLAHTKNRSEVRGGGKKPWKQKGTGRARAGSKRSPIWIGGGITFGPTKDRNFSKLINKKMKQKAIFCTISDKLRHNALVVLDKIDLNNYSTKLMNEIINNIESKILNDKQEQYLENNKNTKEDKNKLKTIKKEKRSLLIINNKKNDKVSGSAKNLPGVLYINIDNMNIIDLLKYRFLILSQGAIEVLEQRYLKAN